MRDKICSIDKVIEHLRAEYNLPRTVEDYRSLESQIIKLERAKEKGFKYVGEDMKPIKEVDLDYFLGDK